MPTNNSLNVQLTVDASGMVTGLQVAGKSVDGAAQAIRQSFKQAADGSDSLSASLRSFKTEASQASRAASFYARDLSAIVPGAGGAAFAIKEMFAAVLSGSGAVAGFVALVGILAAVREEMQAQEVEAQKLRDVHIDAAAQIRKGLLDIQRGLDGDTTAVQKFKQSFADSTTGELVKANKEASALLQKSGGLVDFLRYMGSVFINVPEHATTGIADDIDKAYSSAIEKAKALDAMRAQLAATRVAENKKLDEKASIDEEQIAAQTADAITKIKLDSDAKVRSIRLQTQGSEDAALRARAQKTIEAIEKDSATKTSRMHEDKAQETNAKIRELFVSTMTEQAQIEAAATSTMEKAKIAASRTTDAALRSEIISLADFEVEIAKKKIARVDALQQAQIDAAGVNDGRGNYNSTTEKTTKILQEYFNFEEQRDALAQAHNIKRVADELLSARQSAEEQRQLVDQFEAAGLTTHEQALAARKAIDKTYADQTQETLRSAAKKTAAAWTGVIAPAVSGTIRGMLLQGQSFGDAMKSMFTDLAGRAIDELAKIAIQWVAEQIIIGSVAKATSASTAQGNIAVAAMEAAASAALAGPEAAIAAAAMTVAGLEAIASPLLSAAGGMDIPAGVNPVLQAHAREMVLPATLSDGFRDIIAAGNIGGGGVEVHLHFGAGAIVDQQSLDRHIESPAFQRSVARAVRKGAWRG